MKTDFVVIRVTTPFEFWVVTDVLEEDTASIFYPEGGNGSYIETLVDIRLL